MNILRSIYAMIYLFGYMIIHLPVLRRGEKALAAGDTETVAAITKQHVPHWCGHILKIVGVRVTVEGRENIPAGRACVYVVNHRSMVDIPVMLSCLDAPYGILSKAENQKLPLIPRWMRLIGCVFVDRSDVRASMRALSEATDAVAAGHSFIIFPEGTRYKGEEGGIGECKGGAFRIAVKCGAPIVPVAMTGTRFAFEGNRHILRPAQVTMRILPAMETSEMDRAAQKVLPFAVQELLGDTLADMVKQ